MKNFFQYLFVGLLLLVSTKSFSQGMWTWMGGDTTINSPAIFGTQGIPSVNNHPAATYSPYCWTGVDGNFWLYGGTETYSDMWMFDPSTLEWTWIKGDGTLNLPPVYGVLGVPSPTNTPGNRGYSGCTWVGLNGNLWLYGGSSPFALSDLWMFNTTTYEWTWMSGSSNANQPAIYGLLGVSDSVSYPGKRSEIGNAWKDLNGKFWLYGSEYTLYQKSDMWMYDPLINQWTWKSGSQDNDLVPYYGLQGQFSAIATPGARTIHCTWVDVQGFFWTFGGLHDFYPITAYADLWKYNPFINEWAWIDGSQTINDFGIAGLQCELDSSFYPGARYEHRACWKDVNGNFWLYGGSLSYPETFSDLWVYLFECNLWVRMGNDNLTSNPVYGSIGIPDPLNTPGARFGDAHWTDLNGNFWMFGTGSSFQEPRGDLWRYTPDLSCLPASPCESIFSIPQANIQPITTKLCPEDCIAFDNNSTNASSYEWFFSGASPNYSNDQFPSNICYTTSGFYDVTLIVHNGPYSDTMTINNLIEVYTSPSPVITQNGNTLTCTNAPNNSTFQWYVDGNIITGANDSIYIAATNGLYSVVVTNADECTGSDEINVIVDGITEIQNQNFQLFPNPADESVTIVLTSHQAVQLKLYNTLGQIIYNNMVEKETIIDLSKLSAGMYYITVQSQNTLQAKKLIVTHH